MRPGIQKTDGLIPMMDARVRGHDLMGIVKSVNPSKQSSFRAHEVSPGIQKTDGLIPMMDVRVRGHDGISWGKDVYTAGAAV
jgi:hypothetical protein